MNDSGNFKSFRGMLIFTISQTSPICFVSFQMMPSFFTQYLCDQHHCANFSVDQLFRTLTNLKQVGFFAFTFSLDEFRHCVHLTFTSHVRGATMTTIPTLIPVVPIDEELIAKVDYSLFFSIDSEEFKLLVIWIGVNKVTATLTRSRIKFINPSGEFVLTQQERKCIIGGIREGDEIRFSITLLPIEFFNSFTSKRVWFFKTYDSNGTLIISPMGLHAEISSYFPGRLR
ncbi:uncharacterized protein LOC111806340 [Cucurbita pepo subsp. pepo]|uniref:uncharacterized protein LOC111806340 n=1 Tax=Cucurbita pepo subsp. pepo TaxID=3664 RepID=UPI000C9D66A2|nr:uncharacterized protein LOC111806340 [Cucurbita pepo subsp. pepo]